MGGKFIGALANLAGSLIAYWIGLKGGRGLIEKYGKYVLISKHDLDLARPMVCKIRKRDGFFRPPSAHSPHLHIFSGRHRQNGHKTLFALHLCRRLALVNAFHLARVKMGGNWEQIREKLHNFDLAIFILLVIGVVWYVWRHLKHR